MIYILCSVLGLVSLGLSGRGQISVFLIVVIGGGLVLYLLTRRAREALDRASYSEESEPEALEALRRAGAGLTGGGREEK